MSGDPSYSYSLAIGTNETPMTEMSREETDTNESVEPFSFSRQGTQYDESAALSTDGLAPLPSSVSFERRPKKRNQSVADVAAAQLDGLDDIETPQTTHVLAAQPTLAETQVYKDNDESPVDTELVPSFPAGEVALHQPREDKLCTASSLCDQLKRVMDEKVLVHATVNLLDHGESEGWAAITREVSEEGKGRSVVDTLVQTLEAFHPPELPELCMITSEVLLFAPERPTSHAVAYLIKAVPLMESEEQASTMMSNIEEILAKHNDLQAELAQANVASHLLPTLSTFPRFPKIACGIARLLTLVSHAGDHTNDSTVHRVLDTALQADLITEEQRERISRLQNEIEKLIRADPSSSVNKIASLETALTDVEKRLTEAEATREKELEAKTVLSARSAEAAQEAKRENDELQSKIASLHSATEKQTQELHAVKEENRNLEDSLTKSKCALDEQTAQSRNLEARVAELESESEKADAKLSKAEAAVRSLEEQRRALQQQVDDLGTAGTQNSRDVEKLQAMVEDAEQRAAAAEDRRDTSLREMAELEGQLALAQHDKEEGNAAQDKFAGLQARLHAAEAALSFQKNLNGKLEAQLQDAKYQAETAESASRHAKAKTTPIPAQSQSDAKRTHEDVRVTKLVDRIRELQPLNDENELLRSVVQELESRIVSLSVERVSLDAALLQSEEQLQREIDSAVLLEKGHSRVLAQKEAAIVGLQDQLTDLEMRLTVVSDAAVRAIRGDMVEDAEETSKRIAWVDGPSPSPPARYPPSVAKPKTRSHSTADEVKRPVPPSHSRPYSSERVPMESLALFMLDSEYEDVSARESRERSANRPFVVTGRHRSQTGLNYEPANDPHLKRYFSSRTRAAL